MNRIEKAQANLESINEVIAAAEKWWEVNGASEHPVFNNDLYDLRHDAEDELEMAKGSGRNICKNFSELVSANAD